MDKGRVFPEVEAAIIESLFKKLGINETLFRKFVIESNSTNYSDEDVQNAFEMFLYISYCPHESMLAWQMFYWSIFEKTSGLNLKVVVQALINIMKNKPTISTERKLLQKLNAKFNFDFEDIAAGLLTNQDLEDVLNCPLIELGKRNCFKDKTENLLDMCLNEITFKF